MARFVRPKGRSGGRRVDGGEATPARRPAARGSARAHAPSVSPRTTRVVTAKPIERDVSIRDKDARRELQQLLAHVEALESFNIRTFRHRYGISQERLARAAALPYQTILRWEHGGSKPRLSSFHLFCKGLLDR